MAEQMIPVSQYLIQSCIEQLELALENQVDRHCGVYICVAYTTDAEQNWKESTITKDESNMYPITVPAMSVVTYVGSVQ
jgi:hypothetical protein